MASITVDCSGVQTEAEFWAEYLRVAKPEGAGYFGRNLDAFWDALNGGPGWPGECDLYFTNTDSIRSFRDGRFYEALLKIASESSWVKLHVQ
jgi:RNAse (barnase) inhibitor barstar